MMRELFARLGWIAICAHCKRRLHHTEKETGKAWFGGPFRPPFYCHACKYAYEGCWRCMKPAIKEHRHYPGGDKADWVCETCYQRERQARAAERQPQ